LDYNNDGLYQHGHDQTGNREPKARDDIVVVRWLVTMRMVMMMIKSAGLSDMDKELGFV
jgi:hypothetical protein